MPSYQKRTVNVPVRPLTAGMVVDTPPNLIGKGAFSHLDNYFVNEKGLKKRPSIEYYNAANFEVDYPPINRIMTLGRQDGTEVTLVADKYHLYKVTASSLVPIYDTYEEGTITDIVDNTTYTTLTGLATDWNSTGDRDILAGDEIEVYNGVTLVCSGLITAVDSATSIDFDATGVTPATGVSYTYIIKRRFSNTEDEFYDYCEAYVEGTNYLIITDGNRYPRKTDGDTFDRFAPDYENVCKTISYFADRVWMGHIFDGTDWWRDRVIWSLTLDKNTFEADNSIDLPYSTGTLAKILPLGSRLMLYFTDAIYMGVGPTNQANLPYYFKKIETGSVGTPGVRSVSSTPYGHFIVGWSNAYFIQEDGTFSNMESGVMETYLPTCSVKKRIIALADPSNDMVVVGVPQESFSDIPRWFTYNWKLKAWSRFSFLAQTAEPLKVTTSITYDDIPGGVTYDSLAPGVTYQNYGVTVQEQTIWFGVSQNLAYLTQDGTIDLGVSNIRSIFVTPCYDFDVPDDEKTFTRLSVRLIEPPAEDMFFAVYASIDEYNYRTLSGQLSFLGNLYIRANTLEGKIDLCKTASTLSFHLVQTMSDIPFHVREYVVSLQSRGDEFSQSIPYGTD